MKHFPKGFLKTAETINYTITKFRTEHCRKVCANARHPMKNQIIHMTGRTSSLVESPVLT